MDRDELKAMQTPIKAKFKEDAAAARVTFRAKGSIDETKIACKLETGQAIKLAGLHPATGGSGLELCSGDMLLEALVACAGVTLKAVATALDVKLEAADVVADGDLDFRGTLGVDKAAPVGFQNIRLRFDLKTDAPKDQVEQLIKLTERYCVILQTLSAPPAILVSINTAA